MALRRKPLILVADDEADIRASLRMILEYEGFELAEAASGPDAVQKLNDGGIYHFWQIAAMSPADVSKIDHDLKLGGKIEREGWVAQARELADA